MLQSSQIISGELNTLYVNRLKIRFLITNYGKPEEKYPI
jgi:hypothetical protein